MSDHIANSLDPDTRLQRAAESSVAKIGARIVTPALLTITLMVLGVLGSSLIESQKAQAVRQELQGLDISLIKSDVRNVNTRLDEGVIRQVNGNTEDLRSLKTRVDNIERVVRLP